MSMYKRLSNKQPLKTTDKKYIKTFPTLVDDRFLSAAFNSIPPLLGKYESSDSECLIFNQNNTSEYNTVSCELILLRFGDTDFENDLKSAQKVDIDIRNDTNTTKYHLISGQIDDKEC